MNSTPIARVALVSKEEQDKTKTIFVEEHLPLRALGVNGRGLPCEDEIALTNVNKRKELEKTRKSMKDNKDTENAQPHGKVTTSSSKQLDRKKRGDGANRCKGKNSS